jgi:hypothetical protein
MIERLWARIDSAYNRLPLPQQALAWAVGAIIGLVILGSLPRLWLLVIWMGANLIGFAIHWLILRDVYGDRRALKVYQVNGRRWRLTGIGIRTQLAWLALHASFLAVIVLVVLGPYVLPAHLIMAGSRAFLVMPVPLAAAVGLLNNRDRKLIDAMLP